jgi:hypothetical protein
MGRQLALADKGCLTKMFEPWHARSDSENMEFNNVAFLKWYTQLIDATQRMCIPQELLNLNTRNISFSLNRHHTFVWPRHAKPSDFHTRPLPFYLDEEILDKEVMSWSGVKHNPHKLGMHYLFVVRVVEEEEFDRGSRVEFAQSRVVTEVSNAIRLRRRGRTPTATSQKDLTRMPQASG